MFKPTKWLKICSDFFKIYVFENCWLISAVLIGR